MSAPVRLSVGEIADAVNRGASALSFANAALAAIAAYDAIQPQVWTLRLPEAAVVDQARAVSPPAKSCRSPA